MDVVNVTTSKTLSLADAWTLQRSTSSTAVLITIPLDSSVDFDDYTEIVITQYGTGSVEVEGCSC